MLRPGPGSTWVLQYTEFKAINVPVIPIWIDLMSREDYL